jgi:hypothetical protein
VIAAIIAGRLLGPPEVRQTVENSTLVVATVRARVGKNTTEIWQLQVRDKVTQAALMRMGSGDFRSARGVPNSRTANVSGKLVIQLILHVEHVLPLRPEGGQDAPL